MRRIIFLTLLLKICVGSAQAQTDSLTNGLVSYYPFHGNANDESGNGNNGTVYGATLTNDEFGNPNRAYYFNGSSQYIQGTDVVPQYQTAMTISCWVKNNLLSGTEQAAVCKPRPQGMWEVFDLVFSMELVMLD